VIGDTLDNAHERGLSVTQANVVVRFAHRDHW
jgi:hypothetical protein